MDVLRQLVRGELTAANASDERPPRHARACHEVTLQLGVRLADELPHAIRVFRVEDRAPLREHVDVVDEGPQLVERARVVIDAGSARGEDHAERLADLEQVDALAVDEHVEQPVHHLGE